MKKKTGLVKGLLCSCEDLNCISRIHVVKPGMVACACKPSSGESETGRSLELTNQLALTTWQVLSWQETLSQKTKWLESEE